MHQIELKLNDQQRGGFVIDEGGQRIAEMAVAISGGNIIVYHTEVSETLRGQGVAAKLLEQMVEYARKNQLKVVPLCPYVLAQFKRRTEQYADIWNQNWHQ